MWLALNASLFINNIEIQFYNTIIGFKENSKVHTLAPAAGSVTGLSETWFMFLLLIIVLISMFSDIISLNFKDFRHQIQIQNIQLSRKPPPLLKILYIFDFIMTVDIWMSIVEIPGVFRKLQPVLLLRFCLSTSVSC